MELISVYSNDSREILRKLIDVTHMSCSLGKGTHIGHIYTLIVIAESRSITMSDLARKAELSQAAATRHVQKLKLARPLDPHGEGLVATSRAVDARVKRVRLTKSGHLWVKKVLATMPP